MPRHVGDLSINELVERFRKRQIEIILHLPPDLLAEYQTLETTIRSIRNEEKRIAAARNEEEEVPTTEAPENDLGLGDVFKAGPARASSSTRVPLEIHRATLARFLGDNGPAPRTTILEYTRIPQGSLSALLRDPLFERMEDGRWRLKEDTKKKHNSEPTKDEFDF